MAQGRPQAITGEDVLEALRGREQMALTSSRIAEELDVSKHTALDRLEELHEAGKVRREQIATAYVWFLAEERPPALPPEEPETETDEGGSSSGGGQGGSAIGTFKDQPGYKLADSIDTYMKMVEQFGFLSIMSLVIVGFATGPTTGQVAILKELARAAFFTAIAAWVLLLVIQVASLWIAVGQSINAALREMRPARWWRDFTSTAKPVG